MTLLHRRKLVILSLLFYWPVIFILAHIPLPELVSRVQVSDKVLHFLGYLILTFLLWFAISPVRKVNWRRANVWFVLSAVAAYGAVDELLQSYVGRNCDLMDFLANTTGALTGLILFSFFTFRTALLFVSGIAVFLLTNLTSINLNDQLPVTNMVLHLLGYGLFTVVWLQYIYHYIPAQAPQRKWLLMAAALPAALLAVVKAFSVIVGRSSSVREIVISVAAIAAVLAANYLRAVLRKRTRPNL